MPTLCLCGDYLSFLHFGVPYSGLSSLGLFGAGFPAFSVPVTLRGVAEGYGLVSACLALVSSIQDRRSPLVRSRILHLVGTYGLGPFVAGYPAFGVPVALRGVAQGYLQLVSACLSLVIPHSGSA